MDFQIDTLRAFEAVASLLSFRAAARRLALSPAALSDRIRRLEGQLGCALFERTTRRVSLTPAGERLLPEARGLIEAQQRIWRTVREEDTPPALDLWIGTRFELGLSWLVPALPRLEARSPERRLNLHFAEGPELLARVAQGQLDAAITSAPLGGGPLEFAPLHAEDYALVGGPGSPSMEGPEQAKAQRLLDLSPELPLTRYFLDAAGPGPWTFAETEFLGTIGAVRLRVLQGRGIAVLPLYFVQDELRSGRMVQLRKDLSLRPDAFRLVWRRGHLKTASLQALAAELRDIPLR